MSTLNLHRLEHTEVIYHFNNRVGQKNPTLVCVYKYVWYMHVYTCLFACLYRDPRDPGTLLSRSALFPEGRVSLNMKFTVLVRLSSQLTPSMSLP